MFIVLEGIDGAGKSTQSQRLAEFLREQGRSVMCCADPGTTEAGLKIRQLLLQSVDVPLSATTELLLFFAARAQLIDEVIRPALHRGDVVICDRFLLSSVVYQGRLGAFSAQRIWDLGHRLFGECLPDLTIVLDLPVSVFVARTQRELDRIESRGPEYLEEVRAAFVAEAEEQPSQIKVVDAAGSPDSVASAIQSLVEPLLEVEPLEKSQ